MTSGIISLTKQQFSAFVDDRLDGLGPCRVQEDLPLAALAGTHIVPNARLFMRALEREDTRLTGKGKLNRRFVAMMLDRLHWQGADAAGIRAICKVFDEHDF